MAKGTSWAEAILNSEKIKPTVLAIVKLHESEGISQLVSQSVENYVKYIYIFKFCSQRRTKSFQVWVLKQKGVSATARDLGGAAPRR